MPQVPIVGPFSIEANQLIPKLKMDKLWKWIDSLLIINVLYVLLHDFFMEYRVLDADLLAQAPHHKYLLPRNF